MLKLRKKPSVDFLSGSEGRVIFKFSVPIVLSYLLQQVYTISDAAICGQTLSVDEIAGVNDVFPILFIFLQFAVGCTAGFSVVSSILAGCGNKAGVRSSFGTQLVLGCIMSLVLTVIAILTLGPLLRFIEILPGGMELGVFSNGVEETHDGAQRLGQHGSRRRADDPQLEHKDEKEIQPDVQHRGEQKEEERRCRVT